MSWLSTALKVAQVAGQVLAQIPADVEARDSAAPYQPGGIAAGWDERGNKPYIKNVSEGPVAVNFVDYISSESSGGYSSTIVELDKPNQAFNPQQELDFYRNGEVTVFDASPVSDPQGGPWRAVTFGIGVVLGALATSIASGFRVGVRRTPGGGGYEIYFLKQQNTGLRSLIASVRTASQSTTVGVSNTELLLGAEEIVYKLPDDMDLSRGAYVAGSMSLRQEDYEAIVAPQRARVYMMD